MSDSLRQQVAGLMETCKTVLAVKNEIPPVDGTTARLAVAILAEAKAKNPGDKLLAAITLPEDATLALWSWTSILTSMEIVSRSIRFHSKHFHNNHPESSGRVDISLHEF